MEEFTEYAERGLSGLSNMGNTCFLNSTFQCLSHTYEFHKVLNKSKNQTEKGLLKEYRDLLEILWHKNCIVTPGKFLNKVQETAKEKGRDEFTGYDQNDVSEFLHFMMEQFHDEIARKVKMNIQGDPRTRKDKLAVKCYDMMKQMYESEYSDIISLFYGIHVSQIVNIRGEAKSITPEPFFTVQIPLPETPKKLHLYDCFDKFVETERMSGDNAWTDEKTGEKETVNKGVVFWSLPKILVVELKRYSFTETRRGIRMMKNQNLVGFDAEESLNLSRYVAGYMPSQYQYKLYGVCNHIGGLQGGHYTAFVRNADNKWYHFNDRSITQVKSKQVITPKAYALWFRKIENSK